MRKFISWTKKLDFRLKPQHSILLMLPLSLLLSLFIFWLQPIAFINVYKCIVASSGLCLFLNWFPIILAMMLLYFISSNAVLSVSIVGFFSVLLGTINRYKILLRNDPFLPRDFTLGMELAGIVKNFGTPFLAAVFACAFVYIVFSIVAGLLIRNKKMGYKPRIIGTLACICAILVFNNPLYKNPAIHDRLMVVGNVYNQVNQFMSKGFIYSFIHNYNTNRIVRPNDYSPEAIQEFIRTSDTSGIEQLKHEPKKPHIIMVMGEGYSEFTLNPSLDFTGYTDPLAHYKKIKAESLYGQLIVPNTGGGTADTEFDSLTGLSTRFFRGVPFAFRLISREFDALPRILSRIGYRSEALHPGYSWFYNRQNVFPYFGFDRSVFLDEFTPETQNKSAYISETATIDKLLEMFENSISQYPEFPYFMFCVTIQNHGPYQRKYTGVTQNFSTDLALSNTDIDAVSNYIEGLIDADNQLDRMVRYFENIEDPVVMVYFGDHLPGFPQTIYEEFYPDDFEEGSLSDLTRLNKVPFIVWQNTAAKDANTIDETFITPSGSANEPVFTSNYFGAYILHVLGYDRISPLMDFINDLRVQYPIILEDQSFTPDDSSTAQISQKDKQDLVFYRNWSYYKIFDE